MQHVKLYRFSPESRPPLKTQQLYEWFKGEVFNRSIEPIAIFEVSNQSPLKGSDKNHPLAFSIFKGMLRLKKAFEVFKKRL